MDNQIENNQHTIANNELIKENTSVSSQRSSPPEQKVFHEPIKEESKEINKDITIDHTPHLHTSKSLRTSYMSKIQLSTEKIKKNQLKYNSIIIFDWDNTLLPTWYLQKNKYYNNGESMPLKIKESMSKLEFTVMVLLQKAQIHGDTYIITNAETDWVNSSIKVFYPCLEKILQGVKIISARSLYEKKYPNDDFRWKIETFIKLKKDYENKLTNLICIGDSDYEFAAAQQLSYYFEQVVLKNIRVQGESTPLQLMAQLRDFTNRFIDIYNDVQGYEFVLPKRLSDKKQQSINNNKGNVNNNNSNNNNKGIISNNNDNDNCSSYTNSSSYASNNLQN